MRKLLLVLFSFLLMTVGLYASTISTHALDDVVIQNFKIEMVVDENGKIAVDQKLDVMFNTSQHGIYAVIPEDYNMTWTIDGQEYQRSYHFPIRDVNVIGDPVADQYTENGNVYLQIGDANQYVSGLKTYHYTYTMQMRDLDLNGFQSFYLNLVGQYWSDKIEHVDFSITLPKGWPEEIYFYGGASGSGTPLDLNTTITGNTLTGSYDQVISYGSALTIKADLPDGYFDFIPATDYSLPAILFMLLMSVLVVLAYFRYGRDEKPVETVEFNPIPGLSSAQVGFIFDGFVDSRDVLSLIIEWAAKGYLTITETDRSGFTLTKLMPIPDKEIRSERSLFNALFMGRDEVTNKQLENTFYQHIQHAQADIQRHFQGNESRNIYRKDSTLAKFVLGFLSMLPPYLFFVAILYVKTYQAGLSFVMAIPILLLGTAFTILFSIARQKWISLRIGGKIGFTVPMVFLAFITSMLMFGYFLYAGRDLLSLIILLGLMVTNIFLVSVMDKRTKLGTEYLGRILGLRNFIRVAEKDKLEMLVKEDPEYFYKVLPYAYVLNVSDVWSKKFESIAMAQPSWYVGPNSMNSYLFMHNLNHTLGSMNRTMTSTPRGSGGGSFGGGGGGGFSGGGFGGGGGGHW